MNNTEKTLIVRFAKVSGGAFVLILFAGFLPFMPDLLSVSLGYLFSFMYVGSNFIVLSNINLDDQQQFNRMFYTSTVARFVLVLVAIIFALKVLKTHQIYFTVSFIISYIFHSVIEIIYINKILETDR